MLTINPRCCSVGIPNEFAAQYNFSQTDNAFELHFSDEAFDGSTVTKSINAPLLCGIYFNLGHQFYCRWPGTDKKITFYSNHFTVLNLPSGYSEFFLVNGHHRSIMMNICSDMLRFWSVGYLNLFNGLDESLRDNRPYIFGARPFFIEDRVVRSLNAMIKNDLSGPMRNAKLFTTCQMLMLDCFDHLKLFVQRLPLQSVLHERVPSADKSLLSDEGREMLSRAERYLLSHLKHKMTLEEVAYELSSDPRLLTKLFQRHHNKTVMEWLYNERMKVAQHLLLTTNKSIAEVGLAVSYPIHTHFTKAFKRKWGYFPAVVRKSRDGYEV
jgi:AraC-like DNA-binding protein